MAVALERLQAGTPFIAYTWLYSDPPWLFILKQSFYQTAGWTEYECGHIRLKRSILYRHFVVSNKSMRISYKLK